MKDYKRLSRPEKIPVKERKINRQLVFGPLVERTTRTVILASRKKQRAVTIRKSFARKLRDSFPK